MYSSIFYSRIFYAPIFLLLLALAISRWGFTWSPKRQPLSEIASQRADDLKPRKAIVVANPSICSQTAMTVQSASFAEVMATSSCTANTATSPATATWSASAVRATRVRPTVKSVRAASGRPQSPQESPADLARRPARRRLLATRATVDIRWTLWWKSR